MTSRLLSLLMFGVVSVLCAPSLGQYRLPFSEHQCPNCVLTTYPTFHGSNRTLNYLRRIRQHAPWYADHGGTDCSIPTSADELATRTWRDVDAVAASAGTVIYAENLCEHDNNGSWNEQKYCGAGFGNYVLIADTRFRPPHIALYGHLRFGSTEPYLRLTGGPQTRPPCSSSVRARCPPVAHEV